MEDFRSIKDKIIELQEHYIDGCALCTKLNCDECNILEFINNLDNILTNK